MIRATVAELWPVLVSAPSKLRLFSIFFSSMGQDVRRQGFCCLLCHGIILYKDGDKTIFKAHVKNEHRAFFDLDYLLVSSLMGQEQRISMVKTVKQEADVTARQEYQGHPGPSSYGLDTFRGTNHVRHQDTSDVLLNDLQMTDDETEELAINNEDFHGHGGMSQDLHECGNVSNLNDKETGDNGNLFRNDTNVSIAPKEKLRLKRYSKVREFPVIDDENNSTNMNPWLHAEAMDELDDPNSILRCTICRKSLRKRNFVHHVQIVHWDIHRKKKGPEDRRIEKVKCELNCGRKVQRRNMKRHEKDVHMKKNTCKYCGRKFGSSKTLKIHYYYSHSVHMDAATENVDVLVLD